MLFNKFINHYEKYKNSTIFEIANLIESFNLNIEKLSNEKQHNALNEICHKINQLSAKKLIKPIKCTALYPKDYYKHSAISSPVLSLLEIVIISAHEKIVECTLSKLDDKTKQKLPDIWNSFFFKKMRYLQKHTHLVEKTNIVALANLIAQYIYPYPTIYDATTSHYSNSSLTIDNQELNEWDKQLRLCFMCTLSEKDIFLPLLKTLIKKGIKVDDDKGLLIEDLIIQKNSSNEMMEEALKILNIDTEYIKKGINEAYIMMKKLKNTYGAFNDNYQLVIDKLNAHLEKDNMELIVNNTFTKPPKKTKI